MRFAPLLPVLGSAQVAAQRCEVACIEPEPAFERETCNQCSCASKELSVRVPSCKGKCKHEWCCEDAPECKWQDGHVAQACMDMGGCLNWNTADTVHNCLSAKPNQVCIFATHEILDQVRIWEDKLQAERINYEVVFNHPGLPEHDINLSPQYLLDNGPVLWPPANGCDPCGDRYAFARMEGIAAEKIEDCSQCAEDGSIYLMDGVEYKTCQEAFTAATHKAQAMHPTANLESRPFDPFLNPETCTDGVEEGVSYEFDGMAFSTCREAVNAAVVRENQLRQQAGCEQQVFQPTNGCKFGIC